MQVQVIKDFYGRTIGRIRLMENGDKEIYDFYGRKLGYYRKSTNTTHDFFGRMVAMGDAITMFLNQ